MSTDKRIRDDVATFLTLVEQERHKYPSRSVSTIATAVRFALDAEAARTETPKPATSGNAGIEGADALDAALAHQARGVSAKFNEEADAHVARWRRADEYIKRNGDNGQYATALDMVIFAENELALTGRTAITREMVERCILRATEGNKMIATYNFADAVDNLMELISGAGR